MSITTTTTLSAQVQQEFNMKLLSVPTPSYIHRKPASLFKMSSQNGNTKRFTRYSNLPAALVPLGNTGVNPAAVPLESMNIDAQFQFYGQYVEINDQVTLMRSDPALNAAAERLGESLRRTEDELTRNMLAATASFINCVGGVNGDAPTELTLSDISELTQTLLGADARFFVDGVSGSLKFGTAPIRNAYFALAHTDITSSLSEVAGFIHSSQYPNPSSVMEAEWGAAGNLRFFLSSIGSKTPTSSLLGEDVYNVFCLGREAIGAVEMDTYNSKFIYNAPGTNNDPLHLNSTAGFKFADAQCILNDDWVVNLRCTKS